MLVLKLFGIQSYFIYFRLNMNARKEAEDWARLTKRSLGK